MLWGARLRDDNVRRVPLLDYFLLVALLVLLPLLILDVDVLYARLLQLYARNKLLSHVYNVVVVGQAVPVLVLVVVIISIVVIVDAIVFIEQLLLCLLGLLKLVLCIMAISLLVMFSLAPAPVRAERVRI